jgi:16S rRNA (guanine527-N7)-methyltransferase
VKQAAIKIHQNVSRETFLRLEKYVELLEKWNRTINLIAKSTADDIWNRHIEDSLQLLDLIPADTQSIADFGSGGGLPGLVIACAMPDTPITLVEKDQRKAAFLLQAAQAIDLPKVNVVAAPIESLGGQYDVITARALASLDDLFSFSYQKLRAGGRCLFPKGENFEDELVDARKHWRFKHSLQPSRTHGKSCIITITELNKPTALRRGI